MVELLLAFTITLLFAGALPVQGLVGYLVGCVLTAAVFGIDKANAVQRSWRIPEAVLYLLSLVFPAGGLLGRRAFNHKTQKPAFFLVPLIGATAQAVALLAFA